MFQLTRRVDYALLALAHMAQHRAELATVRELSEHYGIPHTLLAQILRVLARSGLLSSVRGSKGGYRLAREPETITVADVMSCLDMPVQIVSCVGGEEGCTLSPTCLIRGPLQVLQSRVEDVFKATTLADIAAVEGGCQHRPVYVRQIVAEEQH